MTSRPVVAIDLDGVLRPLFEAHDRDYFERDGFVAHRVDVPASELPRSPWIRGFDALEGRMTENLASTVYLHPKHGEWINHLIDSGVEVVWATTWERAAQKYIAPLMGIPHLKLGVSAQRDGYRFDDLKTGDIGAWKFRHLALRYRRRPLVLIDDKASASRNLDVVARTANIIATADPRLLAAAREHKWESDETFAPMAHYEDVWADRGLVTTHRWAFVHEGTYDRDYSGIKAPTMIVRPVPEIGLTDSDMKLVDQWLARKKERT